MRLSPKQTIFKAGVSEAKQEQTIPERAKKILNLLNIVKLFPYIGSFRTLFLQIFKYADTVLHFSDKFVFFVNILKHGGTGFAFFYVQTSEDFFQKRQLSVTVQYDIFMQEAFHISVPPNFSRFL